MPFLAIETYIHVCTSCWWWWCLQHNVPSLFYTFVDRQLPFIVLHIRKIRKSFMYAPQSTEYRVHVYQTTPLFRHTFFFLWIAVSVFAEWYGHTTYAYCNTYLFILEYGIFIADVCVRMANGNVAWICYLDELANNEMSMYALCTRIHTISKKTAVSFN